MKEKAINKIKAKITQKELDLKQSLIDKKNKIGFLNEEQYDSLIRHNHKEIKWLVTLLTTKLVKQSLKLQLV